MSDREDLARQLNALEKRLPALVALVTDNTAFWAAFNRERALIDPQVGPDDVAFVQGRIDCILSAQGLIPGENEGQSCRSDGGA